MNFKNFFDKLQTNHIAIAIIMVTIPLLINIITLQQTFLQAAFYVLLLILLIAINKQINSVRENNQNLKDTQKRNSESITLLNEKLRNDLRNIESNLNDLRTNIEQLKIFFAVHLEIEIEIVDRNKVPQKQGYAKIFSIVRGAKNKVKILCPQKSNGGSNPEREKYFKRLENWIKSKTKNDRSFVFKRLIPTRKNYLNKHLFDNDLQLLNHCKRLALGFPKSADVGSRFVQQGQVHTNFILVDDLYLIVLFPKLASNGNGVQRSDECAFYAIFKDKNQRFFKIFEKQFDLLYGSGNNIHEFEPSNNN